MIVDYQNTPIHLDIYGKGKPLVLIHGFQEERKIWNDFVPILKENYQLIVPDMFGHGETPRYKEVQTMEDMAAAIKVILAKLKVKSAAFIGHSMGGYISLAFLEKYPDQVEKLMLLNSSPKKDSEKRLKERDQVVRIVKKHKQIFVKSSVANLFSEESKKKFKKELDFRIQEAMKMEVESIIAAVKGMKIRKDREKILKNFKGEKWIIAGKEDALIPYEEIKKVARNTKSKFIGLPGGHMSYIEQKEVVAEAFEEFMKA